jgi:hypothetical protein
MTVSQWPSFQVFVESQGLGCVVYRLVYCWNWDGRKG